MVARPNNPIEKVRELQRWLYIAAKRNRERRFHALYDRIWQSDDLLEASGRCESQLPSGYLWMGPARAQVESDLAALERWPQ